MTASFSGMVVCFFTLYTQYTVFLLWSPLVVPLQAYQLPPGPWTECHHVGDPLHESKRCSVHCTLLPITRYLCYSSSYTFLRCTLRCTHYEHILVRHIVPLVYTGVHSLDCPSPPVLMQSSGSSALLNTAFIVAFIVFTA